MQKRQIFRLRRAKIVWGLYFFAPAARRATLPTMSDLYFGRSPPTQEIFQIYTCIKLFLTNWLRAGLDFIKFTGGYCTPYTRTKRFLQTVVGTQQELYHT